MAQAFRVELDQPANARRPAKKWSWTPDSDNVLGVDLELRKDEHRSSNLVVRIHDPEWSQFNELPDPAFKRIPVRLYLAKPGDQQSVSSLAFKGNITSLQVGFPAVSTMTIVAHDQSIEARRQARYRTFRNKTSVQIAQSIAKEYGFDVEVSTGNVEVKARSVDIGAEISDWDHLARALAMDGLTVSNDRGKLKIRQKETVAYHTAFKRGDERTTLDVSIEHVRGPGNSGDKWSPVGADASGSVRAPSGQAANEAANAAAVQRTHRKPVGGAPATVTGAHSEDGSDGWKNSVEERRVRKDSATLTVPLINDIGLHHSVNLEGWGGKIDGTWYIEGIAHNLVSMSALMTTLTLHRGPKLKKSGSTWD